MEWADTHVTFGGAVSKLTVAASSISEAGDYIFTNAMVTQGDYLTKYDGLTITADEANKLKKHDSAAVRKRHDYVMRGSGGLFIEGLMAPSKGYGLGSLLNSAGKSGHKNNCEYVWVKASNAMYVRATAQFIFPGDELFAQYNRGLIDRMGK